MTRRITLLISMLQALSTITPLLAQEGTGNDSKQASTKESKPAEGSTDEEECQ